MPDITHRLDLIESRIQILNLIYGYAHAFDYREESLLLSLFHSDGVIDLGPGFGQSEGHAAIAKTAAELWAKMPTMRHWMSNPLIEIAGDRATAVSMIHGVMIDSDEKPAEVAGRYTDHIERRDGRWAIAKRQFDAHY